MYPARIHDELEDVEEHCLLGEVTKGKSKSWSFPNSYPITARNEVKQPKKESLNPTLETDSQAPVKKVRFLMIFIFACSLLLYIYVPPSLPRSSASQQRSRNSGR